jgi:TPR repeat protein
MNACGRGLLVDRTEQIKWADALDALWSNACVEKGLQMARECRHPDAQWLASLFPVGVPVTRERMAIVMLEQGEDARAMYLAWRFSVAPVGVLRRAAEMGYAPAQASLSEECEGEECFMWAERAAAQLDRNGLFQLGRRFRLECGCAKNEGKVNELYRQAAELEHSYAQWFYGGSAFGEHDWERFSWWGRAALHGCSVTFFCASILRLLRLFAKGELGRILFTVAPLIGSNISVEQLRAGASSLGDAAS